MTMPTGIDFSFLVFLSGPGEQQQLSVAHAVQGAIVPSDHTYVTPRLLVHRLARRSRVLPLACLTAIHKTHVCYTAPH